MKKIFVYLSFALIVGIILVVFFTPEKKLKISNIKEKEDAEENTVLENISVENIISEENTKPDEEKEAEEKNSETENKSEEDKKSKNNNKIISKLAGWGYQKSNGRKIDTIIIHNTYNSTGGDEFSLEKIISIYKSYGVAPHYIISRDGKIYRLVEDLNIAYHAGESKMPDGRTGVNNFSIGIELINSKSSKPTDNQYSSLKYLISYLKGKYSIKNTLGHKDIAPGRKDDPWNLDWKKI